MKLLEVDYKKMMDDGIFRCDGSNCRPGRVDYRGGSRCFSMRACVEVALVLMSLCSGFGLAGCASIDELKNTMSGWFANGKFVGADEELVSDAANRIPADKMEEDAKKASKKGNPARKSQRQRTVELPRKPAVSVSAEAVGPQGPDAHSASFQGAPSRLRMLWPDAPAPGTFSR
jgi:hypothetical protein